MPDKDERQHAKNRVVWREFQNCEIKTHLEKMFSEPSICAVGCGWKGSDFTLFPNKC